MNVDHVFHLTKSAFPLHTVTPWMDRNIPESTLSSFMMIRYNGCTTIMGDEEEEESGGKEDVGGGDEETTVTVDSIIEGISDFDLSLIEAINPSAQGFSSSSAIGWLKEVRRIY